MKSCLVVGCAKPVYCKGYCGMHHGRIRRTGNAGSIEPLRVWKYGKNTPPCRVSGCLRKHHGNGYCSMHRQRKARLGDAGQAQELYPGLTSRRGVYANGYAYLLDYKDHPNASKNGQIAEHVFIMAEFLGRPLVRPEEVHHKNGQRDDNRIENLELWSTSQPAGQRVIDKLTWAREILAQYAGEEEIISALMGG